MQITHSLIGSFPEIDHLRFSLPGMIEEYEARTAPRPEQLALGVMIEMCAQHFYGIDVNRCTSMDEVIGAIRRLEQESRG